MKTSNDYPVFVMGAERSGTSTVANFLKTKLGYSGNSEGHIFNLLGKIYNIGTGVGTSNLEIVSVLRECAEKDELNVRTRILPERGYDVEANVLDSSRLRNHTGWSPKIGLKEGIQKIWNAAKNKKLSETKSKYSDIY